jgi:hypothetical protein
LPSGKVMEKKEKKKKEVDQCYMRTSTWQRQKQVILLPTNRNPPKTANWDAVNGSKFSAHEERMEEQEQLENFILNRLLRQAYNISPLIATKYELHWIPWGCWGSK